MWTLKDSSWIRSPSLSEAPLSQQFGSLGLYIRGRSCRGVGRMDWDHKGLISSNIFSRNQLSTTFERCCCSDDYVGDYGTMGTLSQLQ